MKFNYCKTYKRKNYLTYRRNVNSNNVGYYFIIINSDFITLNYFIVIIVLMVNLHTYQYSYFIVFSNCIFIIYIIEVNQNKWNQFNSFAILCNYVQSVSTTFCLLLFPSISSYNWYQSQVVIMNSTQLSVHILDEKNYNWWCVQMRVLFD